MIDIDGLGHSYQSDAGVAMTVLTDITFSVADGEFIALVGPSGCGKTTLLNMLAGLESHNGPGNVLIDGRSPAPGDPKVGYMLARDCLLPWRRALDNVALVLEMQGVKKSARDSRAREALDAVGLLQFAHSYPTQLSQGMRQRVALARVFVARPDLVLLDEPFSALDAQTRLVVQDAFLRVWEGHQTTVLLVTHDLSEAVSLADRVFIMSRRPGMIKAIHKIDLPRPRLASETRAHPRFQSLYEATWADLRSEVLGNDQELERVAGSAE